MNEAAATLLEDLRAEGWSVALHEDRSPVGGDGTRWLLVHPDGRWAEGVGPTDEAALTVAWDETRKPTLAARVVALTAALEAFSFGADADTDELRAAGLTRAEAVEAARELRDAAILAPGPSVMVDVDAAELGNLLAGWEARPSVPSTEVRQALRLGKSVAKKALAKSAGPEVTDAMVDAAAEVMWTDRDARMGGPWKDRQPDEVCVIQTRATARAAVEAALRVGRRS